MKANTLIETGCRVKAFDHHLYVDDTITPPAVTMKSAIVLRRYAHSATQDDMVDVRFDHNGRESKGHFIWAIETIKP